MTEPTPHRSRPPEADSPDDDATQATAVAPEMSVELPELARGACLGRYVILRQIGRGGMGVVYEAYDPELGRRIALKLVRLHPHDADSGSAADDSRERLLREAQALAQLSHPNVITVYDVGTIEGHVFIAMELVAGRTLRAWRREFRPSRAQILSVFLAAGRALEAAHAAHLIHRDFKPDNVLIGNDGRVRVVDFGLARATEAADASPLGGDDDFTTEDLDGDLSSADREPTAPRSILDSERSLGSRLTEVGRIIGTPRYMAPEQHLGLAVDEKSDQFSFCVALFEALQDQHPFPARDRSTLVTQVTQGRITERPEARIPARLRRIVMRGLAVPPQDRYPDMTALLRDLAVDPWQVRRRIAMAVGVLVLAATAAFGLLRRPAAVDPRCTGISDALVGVWDPVITEAMHERFLATGRPNAQATFERVSALLDQYTAAWVETNVASCDATRRGLQSESLLDARARCLDDALSQTGALTALLSTSEGEIPIDRAVTATLELPRLEGCEADAVLSTTVVPPADPITRARADGLRQRLNRIAVLQNTGAIKTALAETKAVVDEARELDYGPLLASALQRLASLQRDASDAAGAEASLNEALPLAARAGLDDKVARLWVDLVGVVGFDQNHFDQGMTLARAAEIAVTRAGDDPLLEAKLEGTLGSIMWSKGDYPQARLHHERAIAIREADNPEHVDLAISYNNYANVLWDQRDYDKARQYYQRALDIWEKTLGPQHPDVATALANLGNIAARQGHFDQAVDDYQRALDIKRAALGPDNPGVATALTNLGEALANEGRLKEALDYHYQALAIWRMSKGDGYAYVGVAYNNIASVYRRLEDCRQAIPAYQKAIDIMSKSLGEQHLYLAHPLYGLGLCYLDQDQPDQAVPMLQRALDIRNRSEGDADVRASTGFSLGRAMWQTGHDRRRAIRLLRDAAATYDQAGNSSGRDRVEAWLKAHGQSERGR